MVATLGNSTEQEDTYETVNLEKLSNSSVVSLFHDLYVSARRDARSSKLSVLYEAVHRILATLSLVSACEFPTIVSGSHGNCHSTAASYIFDTPERKNILARSMTHSISVHPVLDQEGRYL